MDFQQQPATPENPPMFQLNLDGYNSSTLKSAASWAKVSAIVGFIIAALFVGLGLLMQSRISQVSSGYYSDSGVSASSIGNIGMVTYVFMGIVMIVSSIFALSFSNKISKALQINDQAELSAGFAAIRNYLAFWAILMIVSLLLLFISIAGLMSMA